MRRLHIDAQADHVLRLAYLGDPVRAVIELIWNSLDAEATQVDVELERSDMGAIETVVITDDGHGMAPESIAPYFENLGGSWKVYVMVSPNINRPLNGRFGRGRIRGFALGNSISWTTVADDVAGVRHRTVISGSSSDSTNFSGDEEPLIGNEQPGTIFRSRNPSKFVERLTKDSAIPEITAAFALFLTTYPDVKISFDGQLIDPRAAEAYRAEYPIPGFAQIAHNDEPLLRIIEWKKDPGRAIYLCDSGGAVLDCLPADVRAPGYHFTAYVLWDQFRDTTQDIHLAELHGGERSDLITAVRRKITEHFRSRDAERRAEQVAEWKLNGEYPYKKEPTDEAERAEREVFDYVATTVARKIPKSKVARRTTLGFIREAVASEPGSLPRMLDQLFGLPSSDQEAFNRLLERTSMSKLIAANTIIVNRLDFLTALKEMVFDPEAKKRVKERAELHKILEREPWVFGEEYGLLLSDKSLDQVLERHLEKLRPESKRRRKPVRRADGSRGIVDLMLSQQRAGVNITENLVVELKRPSVVITNVEAGQIKSYAEAVANDPQFYGINTSWDFWVISTEMDAVVSKDAQAINRKPGLIADWDGGIRVWAKTWSQLISECESRLRLFKKALDHDASHEHAADYVNRAHDPKHVPAVFKSPENETP